MAQLNDTLVNGDLRVNGKIYGIITSADSATNASNLGSTAASDFALKNGNYSSNGLIAKSASTAATANAAKWTEKSDDRTYRVAFSEDAQFYYSKQFNYNAGTQTLCAKNISSVNITGTVNGNLSGSAASALTSKSALSAGYATSAGAAPVASHNHNYQLSGNGTALYISAGVNLKPNGNIDISTAANTINISAKDTTYTSLNGINSTEYKALTSTSANSRDPNAHQLSSHTNFSTYFNATSANYALTSKSALTAGSADKVKIASLNSSGNYQVILGATGTQNLYYDSDLNIQYNTSSNTFYSPNVSATSITGVTMSGTTVKGATVSGTTVYGNTISAGKLTGTQFILVDGSATNNTVTAADKAAVNALDNPKIGFYNVGGDQKGYIIWTDYNNSNIWGNADSSFFGGTNITDGFVVTSDQLNSIFVSKNMSATNFKGVTISGTNITAATTVRGTNLSGTNISGATKTMTIDNLISSATRSLPTVNNNTITISTGASPATGSFTLNQNSNKTITLGSMALKASDDYIPNSYSSSTASTFSGKASTAENANKGVWGAVTDNRNYPVAISLDSKFNYTTTTGANHIYFNPASGQLNVVSAVKIGGCQMKWNASTSALDFNF